MMHPGSGNAPAPSMAPCPDCGSTVLMEAVAGQCPRCILGVALEEEEPSRKDHHPDFTGRMVGDYELLELVGTGGMGVVYKARSVRNGQIVAVKMIRDLHVASPALLRRFTIETGACARLDHPHIVPVHEAGECDGHPFFTMDFVEGENLDTLIREGRLHEAIGNHDASDNLEPMADGPVIARFVATIAEAVHHAHLRGVLHRDLKPGNVLLDENGQARLTDFGLAKMIQEGHSEPGFDLTSTGELPGTPGYMSPEQVAGSSIGQSVDIYGLGGILYALLTGRPPFEGPTPLDLLNQISSQPPVPPRKRVPAIPKALETICLKCLEKDPLHRYSTADALAQDLRAYASGHPIEAQAAGLYRRGRQWVKHNPLGTALIASLCLGLSLSLGLLKVVDDQRREIARDRDQAFDEGMQRISQIWRDPGTSAVTISARELAILAGRSPGNSQDARYRLTFGVHADAAPSSMAQRYAHLLGLFQDELSVALGETVLFDLKLLKPSGSPIETLASGLVDVLVINPVDFASAESSHPGIRVLSWTARPEEGVIFVRSKDGLASLPDLKGRSMAFPDPRQPLTLWAKAKLVDAGLRMADLGASTYLQDQTNRSGVMNPSGTVWPVLQGTTDAGIAHRDVFERYRHLGLKAVSFFKHPPDLLVGSHALHPAMIKGLKKVCKERQPWIRGSKKDALEAMDLDRPGLESLRQEIKRAADFEQ